MVGSGRKVAAKGLGLVTLATGASLLLAGLLFGNAQFRDLLMRLEGYSNDNLLKAVALYVLLQATVVIVLFPGLVFTLLAGYLFGPLVGTFAVVSGTVIGASAAFLIARNLFAERFRRVLKGHRTMAVVAESVAHDGWKTVLLTRTIPLFPFKLSNYCFGVIPLSLGQFAAGTLLGVIPLTLTNVSVGALAADMDGLLDGTTRMGTAQYALIAMGIVAGIITFLLVRKRAREKFAQIGEREGSPVLSASCEGGRG